MISKFINLAPDITGAVACYCLAIILITLTIGSIIFTIIMLIKEWEE